jgi:hypothetical protein
MTYREAIQKLQSDIDRIYDDASPMRDCAALDEKQYWNNVRTHLRNAYLELGKLDNGLTDNRADMQLRFTV